MAGEWMRLAMPCLIGHQRECTQAQVAMLCPMPKINPGCCRQMQGIALPGAFGVVRSAQGVLGGRQPLGYMS